MGVARNLAMVVITVVVGVVVLNMWLGFTEHMEQCERLKKDAVFALGPGKPCADFEQRMRLEGKFLDCEGAEKAAASSITACAARKYLADWLPSRVGVVIENNFTISAAVAAVLVISVVYIIVGALVHDRAHQRTVDAIHQVRYAQPHRLPYGQHASLPYDDGSYDQIRGGARLRIQEVY